MPVSTIPATQGLATFSNLTVIINLTVTNTLTGDIVEIIDDTTLTVLGTAVRTANTTNWTASITLPANTTTVNVSARTRRGSVYGVKASPAFAITYQPVTP